MATDSGQRFIRRNRAPRVHITYEDPYDAERLIELPFVMRAVGLRLANGREIAADRATGLAVALTHHGRSFGRKALVGPTRIAGDA